jgi:hypothetical protein
MVRPRPCRVCRRWFRPHPRAGDRQRVCGDEACQRERNRRACARWRAANAEDERAERVRLKVTVGAPGEAPTARLEWPAVRHAVGVEVAVVIQELARHSEDWARHAVRAHPMGIVEDSGRHPGARPRHGIGPPMRDP